MKKYLILLALLLTVAFVSFRLNMAEMGKLPAKNSLPADSDDVQIPLQSSNQSPFNPQQGMTGKQIGDMLSNELAEAGGPLPVWLKKLADATVEAALIKNVKLTPGLQVFLSKVELALHETSPLVYAQGARIDGLLQAKAAYVVFKNEYFRSLPSKAVLFNNIVFFAPNPKSKLPPSNIHPGGMEIDVATDFSRGWAIKLNDRDHIMLHEWNFRTHPPADGILSVETEFE
jgi:hypothetical protein